MSGGTREAGMRSWPVPRLLRLLLLHVAIGFLAATAFVAALLWSDPGGIGELLTHPREGRWPLLLLWFFTGLTFASAQLGAAVMRMDGRGNPGPPRARRRAWRGLSPWPVAPQPVPQRARRGAR